MEKPSDLAAPILAWGAYRQALISVGLLDLALHLNISKTSLLVAK